MSDTLLDDLHMICHLILPSTLRDRGISPHLLIVTFAILSLSFVHLIPLPETFYPLSFINSNSCLSFRKPSLTLGSVNALPSAPCMYL